VRDIGEAIRVTLPIHGFQHGKWNMTHGSQAEDLGACAICHFSFAMLDPIAPVRQPARPEFGAADPGQVQEEGVNEGCLLIAPVPARDPAVASLLVRPEEQAVGIWKRSYHLE